MLEKAKERAVYKNYITAMLGRTLIAGVERGLCMCLFGKYRVSMEKESILSIVIFSENHSWWKFLYYFYTCHWYCGCAVPLPSGPKYSQFQFLKNVCLPPMVGVPPPECWRPPSRVLASLLPIVGAPRPPLWRILDPFLFSVILFIFLFWQIPTTLSCA